MKMSLLSFFFNNWPSIFFGPNYRFYVNVNKISTVVLAPALNRILTTPSTTTYRETDILGAGYLKTEISSTKTSNVPYIVIRSLYSSRI